MSPRTGRPKEHGLNAGDFEEHVAQLLPARAADLRAQWIAAHGHDWIAPSDEALIAQTARSLVIIDQCWTYLERHQVLTSDGRSRAVMKQYNAAGRAITRQLSALGLTPLSRARIARREAGVRQRARRAGR